MKVRIRLALYKDGGHLEGNLQQDKIIIFAQEYLSQQQLITVATLIYHGWNLYYV